LLSEDFYDSDWTDQEVGVAIGRAVPLITVCLGCDPYGLMGKRQGLNGCKWEKPKAMADKIYKILCRRLTDNERLFEAALSVFARSDSFAESAKNIECLLDNFDKLTEDQIESLLSAFRTNDQNKFSFKGRDHLKILMEKWTGKKWTVSNDDLVCIG